MKVWNDDMNTNYIRRKAALIDKGENAVGGNNAGVKELDDVFDDDTSIAKCMEEDGSWNIRGLSTSNKQKEVRNFIANEDLRNFIANEDLSICAVLETHIKSKRLNKIRESIFGQWDWYSNMQHYDKGCRIMLGWNSKHVSINVVNCAKQSMFCKIQTVNENKKILCTFVYATNGAKERRELWKDLQIHKRIVSNQACIIMGDMNVTLNPNEHSAGSSRITSVHEFQSLKVQLQELQTKIDMDPYDKKLRMEESQCIHACVVSQGEDVAAQFVNHFQKFLGTKVSVNVVYWIS
ncbi:RNA-directed DNA polymerase, eukaryota, reverse transcriptase zinc-binding domain protein [Tanacetum coccineum]